MVAVALQRRIRLRKSNWADVCRSISSMSPPLEQQEEVEKLKGTQTSTAEIEQIKTNQAWLSQSIVW